MVRDNQRSDLEDLRNLTDTVEFPPGSIWLLPVSFFLEFPPNLVFPVENSDKFIVSSDNNIWCKNNKYYPSKIDRRVAIKAKVRPFLIIQQPNVLREMRNLGAFSWHKDSIAGLPISSYANVVKHESTKIDPVRLKKNGYSLYHYLAADNQTKLSKDSYVAMTTITRIHLKYFTHLVGYLGKNDYKEISEKISKIFLRQQNDQINV